MDKQIIVKSRLLRILNITIIVIGVMSGVLGIYTYFHDPTPELNCNVTYTNLLDINEENAENLKIIYDSIDIIKNKKNITVILVEMINNGKSIKISDYDKNALIGLNIKDGILLKIPQLINSSDNIYYKDIISNYSKNKIGFAQKIIDENQYFTIKLLVLHDRFINPKLNSFGKISGINKSFKVNFIDQEKIKNKEILSQRVITTLSIALIFILSFLSLSLYKNNMIRARLIELLKEKNMEKKIKIF